MNTYDEWYVVSGSYGKKYLKNESEESFGFK